MGATYDFIGVFACIRGDLPGTAVRDALVDLIRIVNPQPWRSLHYAKLAGPMRTVRFTERKFSEVLGLIQQRSLLTLDLSPLPPGPNPEWWRAYTESSTLACTMSYAFPHPPMGRLPEVGPASNFILTFPTGLFDERSDNLASRKLLDDLSRVFVTRNLSYAFANLGRGEKEPASVGIDDVFDATKSTVPVSAFDLDLRSEGYNLYAEYVRSAFWANLLNPKHVARLGGIDKLKDIDAHRLVPLANGGALVVLTPSPLDRSSTARVRYQGLREFLRPVRAEPWGEDGKAVGALKGLP